MKRTWILGLVGVVLLVAALALNVSLRRTDDVAPPPSAAAPPPSSAAPPAVAAAKPPEPAPRTTAVVPSFDIVRVNPRGDAVIAGRAEPQAEVTVLDGARVVGTVKADERGEWVLLPSEPLPSGARELSLQAARPGAAPVVSDKVVALTVPEPAAGAAASSADGARPAPLTALLVPRDGGASIVVEPGNSLWEMARRRYGEGTAYGAIYEANRGQIRNPDLIYPGQVFVIPPSR